MAFRVAHRFAELEGRERTLLNPGYESYWIQAATQVIDFRLDKSGADLRAEAKLHAAPIPSHFVFDRPFLLVLRIRGTGDPVLAMWVEHPELLVSAGR